MLVSTVSLGYHLKRAFHHAQRLCRAWLHRPRSSLSNPKALPHKVVTPLDRPSTVDAHRIVSGRGLVAAPLLAEIQASPKAISISSANTTAHGPAPSASPTQTFFSILQESQWDPGAISNIVCGCVAIVLGAITVGMTYHLHRRQPRSQQSSPWTTMHLSIVCSINVRKSISSAPQVLPLWLQSTE